MLMDTAATVMSLDGQTANTITSPHGTNELVVYAVLVDPLAEAQRFAVLGR
ncbi:MAG: hypothetical protein R3E79_59330 [Caldilineaceae bacterium]